MEGYALGRSADLRARGEALLELLADVEELLGTNRRAAQLGSHVLYADNHMRCVCT